jgi:hypothetical protein
MVVVKKNNASSQHDVESMKLNGAKHRISKVHADGKAKIGDHTFSKIAEKNSQEASYADADNKWGETLIERGKDLLSNKPSSIAAAAAIVVGAVLIEVELIPGLIIGAGAILLGKFFPEASGYVRPAIKGAVRAGFSATHKIREILAEANEQVQDLVAEVKNEQDHPDQQEHPSIKTESKMNHPASH